MKNRITIIILLIAAVAMITIPIGCKKEEPQSPISALENAATSALCTKCGQIKGTDVCCKAGAEKCAKCGLDKGSPGCCKLPK